MMVHFRQAVGGPAEVVEMLAGRYTVCVVPLPVLDPSMARFMMDKAEELPMKCQEITVGDAPVAATLVVPHAWTVPPPPPKK
jgi:hypothetical protein